MTIHDYDLPLRQDVRLLGDLFGKLLTKEVGQLCFEKIELIRSLSKETHNGDDSSQKKLMKVLHGLSNDEMLNVVRAFSHFLHFANIAENVHRLRRTRWHKSQKGARPQPGSINSTLQKLLNKNIPKQDIFSQICELKIDLVLTAHPTEISRRTLMQKHDYLAQLLLDKEDDNESELYAQMLAIWKTDEIRRNRPTPIDEAKWGFAVIENNIWPALKSYFKTLDRLCITHLENSLPLDCTPIIFSSWMGGDRDGNPSVTAEITEQVCLMSRWVAADLYFREVNTLCAQLSMCDANEELKNASNNSAEPYRYVLKDLKQKLKNTLSYLEDRLSNLENDNLDIIVSQDQILSPLMLCYHSLCDIGAKCIADQSLQDLIRAVHCFGVSLVRLDIRQESSKHLLLLDEVTDFLKLGKFSDWPLQQQYDFIESECASNRPIISSSIELSSEAKDVWDTFLMLAQLPSESLGAYVISMATSPIDVLIVCLLQKEAQVQNPLRVVPLFETWDDLLSAPQCLDDLFSSEFYSNYVGCVQEVMVGYSDSNKDAGILAASWAQFQAQEQISQIGKKHGKEIVFFHGRGGTVGRGGGPLYQGILSQPGNTINGKLRITEQGEVIRNKYHLPQRAQRTLELYTSATLEATLDPADEPKPEWRELMKELASVSKQHYQKIIQSEQFLTYFVNVTPEREIGNLAIASRPSRRMPSVDVAHLRAIPWVFSWMQNRLCLPGWFGVNQGLTHAMASNFKTLDEMRLNWPFFSALLSMLEMILSKGDLFVAQYYDKVLAPKTSKEMGKQLFEEFSNTQTIVAKVLQQDKLLEKSPVLLRSLNVRDPYIYPLHILQAELLERIRKNEVTEHKIKDALVVCISGIAAGLRNTG
jgi:phosphoenolpyruvate carboxylase